MPGRLPVSALFWQAISRKIIRWLPLFAQMIMHFFKNYRAWSSYPWVSGHTTISEIVSMFIYVDGWFKENILLLSLSGGKEVCEVSIYILTRIRHLLHQLHESTIIFMTIVFVHHNLWHFIQLFVARCVGERGGGLNFYLYTSTLLWIRVSENQWFFPNILAY